MVWEDMPLREQPFQRRGLLDYNVDRVGSLSVGSFSDLALLLGCTPLGCGVLRVQVLDSLVVY
jgi:hypothetical protein